MNKFITLVLAVLVAAGMAQADLSLDIDFRDQSVWGEAHGKSKFTANTPYGEITVSTNPDSLELYRDNEDGFGILGGEQDEIDGRNDSINGNEKLIVDFKDGVSLTGVFITDLFDYQDGNSGDPDTGELGKVVITLFGTNPPTTYEYEFNGNDSDQANGEQYISFTTPIFAESALFEIVGSTVNNEFSVAGFTVIPAPGAILLGSLGTVLVGYLRRKRSL